MARRPDRHQRGTTAGRSRRPRRLASLMPATTWAALAVLALVVGHGGATGRGGAPETRSDATTELLARGAELYAFHCTTCHGATGQGFDEARAAFPDDHRFCARCHGTLNPPVMTPREIDVYQSAFSLGVAPPLADGRALARYGTAGALFRHVRATMPRWYPGRLSDDEYRAITAHLLRMADLVPAGATIDPEALDDLELALTEP